MSLASGCPGGRRRVWIVAGTLILLGCAALALATHARRRGRSPVEAGRPEPPFDALYLRDVTYVSYDRAEKVFSLRAGEIIHRKRKIGPLTLNPVKEIEMRDVRIEIYRAGAAGSDGAEASDLDLPIRSILDAVLSAKHLGFVSRVIIRQLDLIVFRGRERTLSIAAGRVFADLGPGAVRFEDGFTLESVDGGTLVATSADWRPDGRRLVVRGPYRREDARGSDQDEGGSFRISPEGTLTKD